MRDTAVPPEPGGACGAAVASFAGNLYGHVSEAACEPIIFNSLVTFSYQSPYMLQTWKINKNDMNYISLIHKSLKIIALLVT